MTLSTSQPNIDWSVRAFDDDDLGISQQFRSGCLECGDILAHPKYKKEGILGAVLLPHSLIQFGVGWFRSIPMGYLGQDPSLELGTESLTPDLVDDFSLKLLSSIFTATADFPKYTASGGLSDLFKSNMFKDAASISSITTKKTKAMQDYISDKANTEELPKRKLSSSLSPLSHVSPAISPQILNATSPKTEINTVKETSIASPVALTTTEIKIKDESLQQEDIKHNSPAAEKSPPSMPEPVSISIEENNPSDLKRISSDSSSDSPRKSQRLTTPVPESPPKSKSPEVATLASPDIPATQVNKINDTTVDKPTIEHDSDCVSPKDLVKAEIEMSQNDKSPEETNGSNGVLEAPPSPLESSNKLEIKEKEESPKTGLSSLDKSPSKTGLGSLDKSPSKTGLGSLDKSPSKTGLGSLNKSPSSKMGLGSLNKSPSPKPVSPSKSNLSLISRSPSPTSEKILALSEESREAWQNIEKNGYPTQALPSLTEELQDSYWTKFYNPTDAFPMKMFSKYTIHFFTSARTEGGPLPSEIDLDGPPGIVADNMIALVRKIYDKAGSNMSHDLKATVNQALCVIGRYLSDKNASVVDDFITRNYQPVNKKVSSADRIAAVARFVSRVWDSRSPISRMSNLHVNFYKLAGLLGEQGTNSIVSALQHLQEKYPPIYD